MGEAEHTFGGDWTERKLDALLYYLQFYTVALKGKTGAKWRFDLWYIDALGAGADRGPHPLDHPPGLISQGLHG